MYFNLLKLSVYMHRYMCIQTLTTYYFCYLFSIYSLDIYYCTITRAPLLTPLPPPHYPTPVTGGLTLREGMYISEELARTGRLRCVDLVEVNASLGDSRDARLTLQSARDVIEACFAKRLISTVPEGYVLPKP